MPAIRTTRRVAGWRGTLPEIGPQPPRTPAQINASIRRDRGYVDCLGEIRDEVREREAKLRAEVVTMEPADEGQEGDYLSFPTP